MKHLFLVFLLLATMAAAQAGIAVKIVCDPPLATDPAPIGYMLYRKGGTAAAPTWVLVKRFDTPDRVFDVTADGAGTYALTAFNAGGESDRSEEITIPGKPGKPIGVRITVEFTP